MKNLNWYPGHMKKTERLIDENLKLIDIVVEIRDARIPISSANPLISKKIGNKKRVVVLNKCDLADPKKTEEWINYIRDKNTDAIALDAVKGYNIDRLIGIINSMNSLDRKPRIIIVGIPNVGKSSLINRLAKRRGAQVGNKPGVTKGKQWITTDSGIQLLDTPGILWPKFEDNIGTNLAFCGSIKDDIFSIEDLAYELVQMLQENYEESLKLRYNIDEISSDPLENMDMIAEKRGFIMSGKRIDYNRMARAILDDFRSGKLGRITIENMS